jgi:dTDP-4-amino-4,6-dideoxygalactose transaminase
VAQGISERGINLPSYPDLTEADVRTICSNVAEFWVQQDRTVSKIRR